MENLFDRLLKNGESDTYPYHMPGHKRRSCGALPEDMFLRDITEIDGFDNLHQPEGILRELQKRAAQLYGADESFCMVNGSTGGILSAISAALPAGGHILMARNCHKSAYHGAYLRGLTVSYLYPPMLEKFGVCDAVAPEQVSAALEQEPDIGAVLIVSPSYEGRISDVRRIAEIVHARGIPLIVDEAHGAHLGFGENFAENSCRAGADLVIHSVHKTLPALTQSALLHVNGELIDRELLKRFLRIYQSSSPSYLLMAGVENALSFIERDGKRAFREFAERWNTMQNRLAGCRHLRFLAGAVAEQDVGKLFVSVKETDLSGRELYDILLSRYHLQMEMASEEGVLAMFTVNDTEEGYDRLTQALLEIDAELRETDVGQAEAGAGLSETDVGQLEAGAGLSETDVGQLEAGAGLSETDVGQAEAGAGLADRKVLPLAEAWDAERTLKRLKDAGGCCAGEFVNLYPPGIPILVPGEHITEEIGESIRRWLAQGLTVQGVVEDAGEAYIKVLK